MRILIAVNPNDEGCADSIAAATALAWPNDAAFLVLSVAENVHPPVIEIVSGGLDIADIQQETNALAKATAGEGAVQLRKYGFNAEGVSIEGDPKSAIPDYADEWKADLIMVGSCERSRIENFFVGSVSQRVVIDSPCSVLVVKPSGRIKEEVRSAESQKFMFHTAFS